MHYDGTFAVSQEQPATILNIEIDTTFIEGKVKLNKNRTGPQLTFQISRCMQAEKRPYFVYFQPKLLM